MPVITRWYVTRADQSVSGPYKTERAARNTIKLSTEEQFAQNRVNEKHARVWSETVLVSKDADDYVMRQPPPHNKLYIARIPAPWGMPDHQGSGKSREDAIALLTKIVTNNGSRPFPDHKIEVHQYVWKKEAMTVHDPPEETNDDH